MLYAHALLGLGARARRPEPAVDVIHRAAGAAEQIQRHRGELAVCAWSAQPQGWNGPAECCEERRQLAVRRATRIVALAVQRATWAAADRRVHAVSDRTEASRASKAKQANKQTNKPCDGTAAATRPHGRRREPHHAGTKHGGRRRRLLTAVHQQDLVRVGHCEQLT